MVSKNLTYSVRDIFTQCLHDHQATHFLIAAYQRGYKWEAGEPDATEELREGDGLPRQVDKLLTDLWRAFEARPKFGAVLPDYFLQFITLKAVAATGTAALEVVDGQQRLTTLSLLFAVIRHLLADKTGEFDFIEASTSPGSSSSGKLDYAVRAQFLAEFVYQGRIVRLVEPATWEAFLAAAAQTPGFDRDQQDVYYLYRAARRMQGFLQAPTHRGRLAEFGRYVADHGRLLANVVAEEETSSEELFSNLNRNRVLLTEPELIKGLLLTYASRQGPHAAYSFRELQELRGTQGRQWDELARWLNQESVTIVYGWTPKTALWHALRLAALRLTAQQVEWHAFARNLAPNAAGQSGLFELFERLVRTGEAATSAAACFAELRLVVNLLRDWHGDPQTYNLLGALRECKGISSKNEILPHLTAAAQLARESPAHYLQRRLRQLPCLAADLKTLSYDEEKEKAQLFDLLLLLNIFPEEQRWTPQPFNFVRFAREAWSLEHVFPQNPPWPADGPPTLPERAQLQLLGERNEAPSPALAELLQASELTAEQAEQLRTQVQLSAALLHGAGNLTLLPRNTNSSFGNKSFAAKRQLLIEWVRAGSFVPPHTFGVFSKLVLPEARDLLAWTKADIREHADYLSQQQQRLREADLTTSPG